ncbi:DUF2855 family protein [Atopomonas sediminilitoris]|uniref:DUF2855 family protein n=1 Tax=Atopomonas sediminilitoris TaxID=2919919 RepID=UPI001F4DC0AA|nr:DUF2855 family protein [Atopomonas sediminilitoris]MCJ8170635.1 DUF2855 family protein [Atopomonas sediminilitoris]
MSNAQTFTVTRQPLGAHQLQTQALPSTLRDGQVLLHIEHFALTANNITYAALGDALGYWQFFPASDSQGVIPVWGFAQVLQSSVAGISNGERFYGYYPMATHLLVNAQHITAHGFTDGSVHRQDLPAIYNQYLRTSTDPLYQADSEALQMLLRPLFTTSFLLDDFFASQACFGATQLCVTSASSKTAIGTAYLLRNNREHRGQNYEVVGLTSARNRAFVEGLGCYDRVLCYDDLSALSAQIPSAIIDLAGNAALLQRLHQQLGDGLRYSCRVGAAHWTQASLSAAPLHGPKPVMFFAPNEALRMAKQHGAAAFQQQLAAQWQTFSGFAQTWLRLEYGHGEAAIASVYHDLLKGQTRPEVGHLLAL